MIVGGKQGLCPQPGIAMDILSHGSGDGKPIIGAGAPPNLIKDEQRARRGIIQDIGRLHHLHHKGGLTRRQVFPGTNPGKDTVDQSNSSRIGGNKAAHLGKEHN